MLGAPNADNDILVIVLMVIKVLILITLFLLSRTQNYMPLLSLYQQKTIKNYQNFIENDFKNKLAEMNIKQKVKIKMQHMSIEVS